MTEVQGRPLLVQAGQRLLAEGLVARSWGNLSLRLGDGTMLITPSGIPYPVLTEEMLVVVNLADGSWSGGYKPSGERKVHREIYRSRSDVSAVVHTHQFAASAASVLRRTIPLAGGAVQCAPYALPGTKKLTAGTVKALGDGPAVLMANHGVFAVGADLDQAFVRIAELERGCADYLASQSPSPFPDRADARWQPRWLTPCALADGTPGFLSVAPFTLALCQATGANSRRPLRALLDDLAQLAGPQVPFTKALPAVRPRTDAVLVPGSGAWVTGDDAEALAMVLEKNARAFVSAQAFGGARSFPGWEASLMHLVYQKAYSKKATQVL